jgi:DNA polymerase III alpha subunit
VSLSVEQLRILIRIGAFRFTNKTKKELLWEIHTIMGNQKKTMPASELFEISKKEYRLPRLEQNAHDDALDEIEILGFPLSSPFDLLKEKNESQLNVQQLLQHTGQHVTMVGYYVVHKITRTVKGQDMSFGTFLDINGHFFDTTHFPDILDKYPFTGKGCYRIEGRIAEEFGFPTIEVNSMKKLMYLEK